MINEKQNKEPMINPGIYVKKVKSLRVGLICIHFNFNSQINQDVLDWKWSDTVLEKYTYD